MNRLVSPAVWRTDAPARRLAATGLALALALILLVTPALAAPATIVDNTAGTATNDGTVGSGEYVGYTAGINGGFGNVIGSGSQLHVDSDASGALNFGLITGGGSYNDAMVVYIDSVAGGYSSTSTFDDTADGCRRAISGYDGANRSILTFAPGFQADYAICMDTSFAGVWQLAGTGSHPFVASANRTTTTAGQYEMALTLANLGLAAGGTFKYVATYLNPGNAYRSDEFHGVAQSTVPGGNPGNATVTLASGDYNMFTSYATVVASAGGSSAGYATLKGAFDAINNGVHTGAISVKINASTSETASAVLNASGSGSASYTTVAIGPGNTGVSVGGSVAGALVDLNGADNVTIDGRVGGAGSSKDLTFENTNNSNISGSQGVTLRFRNDATGNAVRYMVLRGAAAGTTSSDGVVSFADAASGGSGNSTITIEYCDIRESSGGKPINGIAAGVTTGAQNSAITIQYNNIFNFFQAGTDHNGIKINSGAGTGWTITGNSFYKTVTDQSTAGTYTSAIYIANPSGNGFSISNNSIGGRAPNAGGSPWTVYFGATRYATRLYGIRLSVGTTSATSVQGNVITNFDWQSASSASTSGGMFAGILVSGGAVNIGTTAGNTVGGATGVDLIKTTISNSGGATTGIWSESAGAVTISNNVIGGITATGTTTSLSASINGIVTGSSGAVTISNNTIGSASTANSINAANASTSATAQFVTGINGLTSGAVSISNNTIANLNNAYVGSGTGQTQGIVVTASTGAVTITGNTVRNMTTAAPVTLTGSSAALIGIAARSSSATGVTVTQNVVHSLSATAGSGAVGAYGMYFNLPFTGAHAVARNFVHSLKVSTASTTHTFPAIAGMAFAGGTGVTVSNNMIRLGIDASGNSITTGYWIDGIHFTATTGNFYYNTVYVGGTGVASSANTAAFNSNVTSNARIYKNNIWFNARSNASGAAVNAAAIIAGTLPNPGGLTSNYNLYYAPGTGGQAVRNGIAGTNYATLADWQTASGQDANSISGDPLLANPTGTASTVDLHINPSALMVEASPVSGAGTPIAGITDDFDGDTRNASAPDIGADEFTPMAVTLASFTAQGGADRVTVTWETLSEVDNAGFNIYRSDDAAAPQTLLAYVPSQGPGSTQGFAYTYEDLDVRAGHTYWYWLEDVSLSGATTLHGPVSATVQAPTAVTLAGLEAGAGSKPIRPWAIAAALAALVALLARLRRQRRIPS